MRDCRSVEFSKEIDNQSSNDRNLYDTHAKFRKYMIFFLIDVSIENAVTMRIAHTFTMHIAPVLIYNVLIDYFRHIMILYEEISKKRSYIYGKNRVSK